MGHLKREKNWQVPPHDVKLEAFFNDFNVRYCVLMRCGHFAKNDANDAMGIKFHFKSLYINRLRIDLTDFCAHSY